MTRRDRAISLPMSAQHAALAAGLLLALAACSGGDDGGGGDAGFAPDAMAEPDAGVRALCPVDPNPACTRASDCMMDRNPSSNCAGCVPTNLSLCQLGQCVTPDQLSAGDPINFVFTLEAGLLQQVRSFAGVTIAAETAGGQLLTCEDVYAGRIDLTNGCYNLLATRGAGKDDIRAGDLFTVTFTRFASGQRSLFVVYGYTQDEQMQSGPIGVSCGAFDVPAPGAGLQRVPGDTMRLIQ